MILFLYFKINFYINILMTVAFLFIEHIFFQIKQKTVQTLLKWLFWTSINLDIIKQNIILAEVFISISCAFYPCVG